MGTWRELLQLLPFLDTVQWSVVIVYALWDLLDMRRGRR